MSFGQNKDTFTGNGKRKIVDTVVKDIVYREVWKEEIR